MEEITLLDVVNKVIGDTSPTGCSTTDCHNIKNTKELGTLLHELVMQVGDNTKCIFDYRASMQEVSKVNYDILKVINTITQEYVDDFDEGFK